MCRTTKLAWLVRPGGQFEVITLFRNRFTALIIAAMLLFSNVPAVAASYKFDSVDVDLYRPLISRRGSFGAPGGSAIYANTIAYGVWLQYMQNPLVWRSPDNRIWPMVKGRFTLTGAFAYAPLPWLELQAFIPVTIYQLVADDPGLDGVRPAALGDIRLAARTSWVPWDDDGPAFSLRLDFAFPTGDGQAFSGAEGVVFWPELAATIPIWRFDLNLDVGYRVQKSAYVATLAAGPGVTFGAGLRYPLLIDWRELGMSVAIQGEKSTADDQDGTYTSADFALELLSNMDIRLTKTIRLEAGFGVGLTHGYGNPDFRIIAGMSRMADDKDTDRDGIPDKLDRCPLLKEDFDGVMDGDGCPETDGDLDGIPDEKDQCPEQAETLNNFMDHDGCPEDLGEDRDGDGIPDAIDFCPDDAEDYDGFEDRDGCPEEDNDNDSVPDNLDKCPNEPETINGYLDDDGCPDEGAPATIYHEKELIETIDSIHFETALAIIKPESKPVLDQVARQILAHPDIALLRIEGYTDDVGPAYNNLVLSQKRAESVMAYLVGQGVGRERLVAVGMGEANPIATNKTPEGRSKNRRVEFVIEEIREVGDIK